uniref:Centrosomal protein of 70 kDa n=1 Tax=Mola mola TaxID=94237 RepID=A0A3Q3VYA1_MOLML
FSQQEQLEWDDVNKRLQHHGFKPVFFADPVENRNLSDLVLLDKKSAGEIRTTLRTMLTDSDRRQTLIQELIKSNNQLKEEAHGHKSRAAQHSDRAIKLEGLLDALKTRIQDLEDGCLGKAVQQLSHTQQLQWEKQEAQKLSRALEQELSKQKKEAAQLQRKLYFTTKEEERRLARQNQAFKDICNKVSRQNSPADQQVLDVIEFYETKMTQLMDELSSNVSSCVLSKAYQDQQKESKSQIEALMREMERLKQELETRCVCVRACVHSLLMEINAVVTNSDAPFWLHRQRPSSMGLNKFEALVPTLEMWAQQLHLLKDLQKGLNKLTGRLTPWQTGEGDHRPAEEVKVEDMMLLVNTMLENTATDDEKVLRSPTRYTLGSMVSHFQKLFDVTSLSGVFPRMNEVYTRLGEMTNIMRNLQDILQLDDRTPPAQVVNHVARLASSSRIHDLLGDDDIDSVIVKVRQHEEFFPAFHALIVDILQTLGVSNLDDILPALKSLKQTAR